MFVFTATPLIFPIYEPYYDVIQVEASPPKQGQEWLWSSIQRTDQQEILTTGKHTDDQFQCWTGRSPRLNHNSRRACSGTGNLSHASRASGLASKHQFDLGDVSVGRF